MEGMNRRTAIAFGLTVAAASTAASQAKAAMYRADEGEPLTGEGFKGVRRVNLSERETMIPGFKKVVLMDLVFDPGAVFPVSPMPTSMVCHMVEGELQVTNNGQEITVKPYDVWTCDKGGTEGAINNGSEQAVMRVARLEE